MQRSMHGQGIRPTALVAWWPRRRSRRAFPTCLRPASTSLGIRFKKLVQAGSVIGRSFSVDLAQQAAAANDALVENTLGRLVDLGLASIRGRARQRVCTFRHVLTQEAIYQSMLRDTRRTMHRRIAELLKHAIPDTRKVVPEVLAYHYAEAGDIPEAVDNYHQAGRLAAARSANIEAKRLLSRALELLRALPPSQERDDQELVTPRCPRACYDNNQRPRGAGRANTLRKGGQPMRAAPAKPAPVSRLLGVLEGGSRL